MSGGDFFSSLASQISDQYGFGENTDRTLDLVKNGQTKQYGKLGDLADSIDTTEERRYTEEGYLRRDSYNADPKLMDIIWQEPSATVLVKKRMFGSLSENNRLSHMDFDERLFYRASKILFQNKLNKIAAFEKLTKIERVSSAIGYLDDSFMPLIINSVDTLSTDGDPSVTNQYQQKMVGSLADVIERVKKIYSFSKDNFYSTWIIDKYMPKATVGEGTGVIEFTNFKNIRTSLNLNGTGSASVDFIDPYKYFLINDYDIEKALADAINIVYATNMYSIGKTLSADSAADNIKKLNKLRTTRGASKITFNVNQNTYLGKRVTAVIDRLGVEILFDYGGDMLSSFKDSSKKEEGGIVSVGNLKISKIFLKDSDFLGQNGLDDKELHMFKSVVSDTFNQISLDSNSNSTNITNNLILNYARKKMRLNYNGKFLIQPMDSVHIYLSSKTASDNCVTAGIKNIFSGLGFFQKVNNISVDLKNQFDAFFNPSTNIDLDMERSAIVGNNFPSYIWQMTRNIFVNDRSGTHVFGGVVSSVSESFSSGFHTLSMNASDNSVYQEMGVVNLNPSADTFNGSLYDPLTKYKTSVDAVTSADKKTQVLLDENLELLKANIVRHKTGPLAGQIATEANLHQDYVFKNGVPTKITYDPDGFVYKWKEGIGTLTMTGSLHGSNHTAYVGSQNTYMEPFAGQDIMNVISLGITGLPYNYITYYKGINSVMGADKDPMKGSNTFIDTLTESLSKRNYTWGNFIPFKSLQVDEASYRKTFDMFRASTKASEAIDIELQRMQDLQRLIALNSTSRLTGTSVSNLQQQYVQSRQKVESLREQLVPMLKDDTLVFTGSDVSIDTDELTSPSAKDRNDPLTDPSMRRELRKRINTLTKRYSWQVRANEDKNLFIVDDYYDKDYDLMAFDKQLNKGFQSFNNNYLTVKEKIHSAAHLLNFEVFCDSQGHIRARPPQYNKTPSSVFYKMIQSKATAGIQIFPEFIESMFYDQITSLSDKISVIELYIRLLAALIGYNDDESAISLINSKSKDNRIRSPQEFAFLSDREGNFVSLPDITKLSNPDTSKFEELDKTMRASLSNISRQVRDVRNVFNTVQRANLTLDTFNVTAAPKKAFQSDFYSTDTVNELVEKIKLLTGSDVALDEYWQPVKDYDNKIIRLSTNAEINFYRILKSIGDKIAERQAAVKVLYNSVKNLVETKSVEHDQNVYNKVLYPALYGLKYVPEVFEHMIEDETYDDYGPGSGKRYIVKNTQVLSASFEEAPPPYTHVVVNGQLSPETAPTAGPSFSNGIANGQFQNTALALDYDMMRMYGLKQSSPVTIPFFTNADVQCAPYAAMLLSRARKEVLKGSVTVIGNEYYQLGDVVFIEDRNLLFYVTAVSHNFSQGSGFSTTLTLEYGHCPGEYIPSPLDIIGKVLYNNKDSSSNITYRQSTVFDQDHLGVIIYDERSQATNSNDETVDKDKKSTYVGGSAYGSQNEMILNQVLVKVASILNDNKNTGSNINSTVEIRIYYSKEDGAISAKLKDFAGQIKDILQGKKQLNTNNFSNQRDLSIPPDSKDVKYVVIKEVDLSDKKNGNSPSHNAISQARMLAQSTSAEDLKTALFSSIVDCWVSRGAK